MANDGQNFKNPDLKQIWEALSSGNLIGYLQILANAANTQNNLVSLKTFEGATISEIIENYNIWIDDNPDWIILNEISCCDNTTGTWFLTIRYKGEKTTSDEPA